MIRRGDSTVYRNSETGVGTGVPARPTLVRQQNCSPAIESGSALSRELWPFTPGVGIVVQLACCRIGVSQRQQGAWVADDEQRDSIASVSVEPGRSVAPHDTMQASSGPVAGRGQASMSCSFHGAGLRRINRPQTLNTMMASRVMRDFMNESTTCS